MTSDDSEGGEWGGKMWKRFWDQTRDPLDADRTLETFTGAVQDYKEVSGAAAAERATELAREQYEEQKKNAEAQRLESQAQVSRDQVAQSNRAGAARNAGRTTANKGQAVGGGNLGTEERDFLGL